MTGHDADLCTPRVDLKVPAVARIYDYFLGGKDNYAADRAAAAKVMAVFPTAPLAARDNRAFMARALKHLLMDGRVAQFVDIGTGLTTSPSPYEVAHHAGLRHGKQIRGVGVDNDEVVLAHGRALLATTDSKIRIIQGDLRYPAQIWEAIRSDGVLDLAEPVAVLLGAIMHFISPDDDPGTIVRVLMEPLPAGSALILTHATSTGTPWYVMQRIIHVYATASSAIYLRTEMEIRRLFEELGMLSPGAGQERDLVPVQHWRPEEPGVEVRELELLAGVAIKR